MGAPRFEETLENVRRIARETAPARKPYSGAEREDAMCKHISDATGKATEWYLFNVLGVPESRKAAVRRAAEHYSAVLGFVIRTSSVLQEVKRVKTSSGITLIRMPSEEEKEQASVRLSLKALKETMDAEQGLRDEAHKLGLPAEENDFSIDLARSLLGEHKDLSKPHVNHEYIAKLVYEASFHGQSHMERIIGHLAAPKNDRSQVFAAVAWTSLQKAVLDEVFEHWNKRPEGPARKPG